MADTEPNGVDVWLIKWAISNCHTLARRRIKAGSTDSDWWGHVLRLCEKAGAKSLGVLRVGECDALGQAATDAEALEGRPVLKSEWQQLQEALAAKDKEIARLTEEVRAEQRRADFAKSDLTAERQKVRELREQLVRHMEVAKSENSIVGWAAMKLAIAECDALALTGDATEGQG